MHPGLGLYRSALIDRAIEIIYTAIEMYIRSLWTEQGSGLFRTRGGGEGEGEAADAYCCGARLSNGGLVHRN